MLLRKPYTNELFDDLTVSEFANPYTFDFSVKLYVQTYNYEDCENFALDLVSICTIDLFGELISSEFG